MAEKNMDAKISVDFEESSSRQQLNSGEDITTLFGKIRKFFSDLKAVAFSGSYADLSDKPESLPANGGNADTVNGHSVNADVPENAVFTDTVPDLSAYAKKTDVPNIKVNAAVDADTVCGRSVKDLAYINDIICGLKNGWAYNTVGTVLTYGDREVVKTTADLSYIGWTIDSRGWFVPIIVSQYASGTNYTMYGQNCGYDFAGGNDRATFDYKNRTYYACWSSPASYQSPSVVGGLHLTVTNNDYISACKTLIDNCELIDANFSYTADTAYQVVSPNNKIKLYEDGEGGNFELTSPDGSHFMQMDLFSNTDFRMYFGNRTTGEMTFPFFYKFDTGKIELNGTSDIYTVLNKPYVTGTLSEQASDSPVTMSFTIFDFTPSKVICQLGNESAFFANVVTNGFSLTIPAGTTTIHYIAFK